MNTEFIYLFDDSEDIKQPIRTLSQKEVAALHHANEVLYEFQYYNRRMLEINFNYMDYQDTVSKYSNMVREINNLETNADLLNEIFVNVNRTFINFVSSLKVFVEHFGKHLISRYSSDFMHSQRIT